MKMRTVSVSVLTLALLAACSSNAEEGSNTKSVQLETVYSESADRPASPATTGQREAAVTEDGASNAAVAADVSFEAQGAPEGTDALAQRLRARHLAELPSAEDVAAIDQAAEKLLFIEANAGLMVERQRAISLMRHVYTPEVRARLLELAGDTQATAPVRTAALRSLVAARAPEDVEAAAVLERAKTSTDPRVRRAVEASEKAD